MEQVLNPVVIDPALIMVAGAFLSYLIKFLKKRKVNIHDDETRIVAISLSIILGGAIYFLRDTQLWATLGGVFLVSQSVYTMIISRQNKK